MGEDRFVFADIHLSDGFLSWRLGLGFRGFSGLGFRGLGV